MSNQSFTQSRRNFLKGAVYTTALSVGGITSLGSLSAFATDNSVTNTVFNPVNNGITVMQQQMLHKEIVSLFNQTDDAIMLDALQPITIEKFNDSLIVRPNIAMENACCGLIMLAPGQRVSFDIQTGASHYSSAEVDKLAINDNQTRLHISSEHSAFNKLISVVDAVA